ncbi:MAG: hypothetical protein NTW94_07240 [Legionellales bacterium]|nr:hypothetical protein [Legionellales bacterium]
MPETTLNGGLIRIHPREGGAKIIFKNQMFCGVSPDVFLNIDSRDKTHPFRITRKLNLTIQINPEEFSAEHFFQLVTRGESGENPFVKALKKTHKCEIHGDGDTGLCAHPELLKFLELHLKKIPGEASIGFEVDGAHYFYHSVGVAANHHYGAAGQRLDNPFVNHTSHFEIKFRRKDHTQSEENLCLNIHLQAIDKKFAKKETFSRLVAAVRLFYRELGVLSGDDSMPETLLRKALTVDHFNYEEKGFSIYHPTSVIISEEAKEARKYIKLKGDPRGFTFFDHLEDKDRDLAEKPKKPIRAASGTSHVVHFDIHDDISFPPLSR